MRGGKRERLISLDTFKIKILFLINGFLLLPPITHIINSILSLNLERRKSLSFEFQLDSI